MHYCWDDLYNSGKVFRKEVGQSDSIITRRKKRKADIFEEERLKDIEGDNADMKWSRGSSVWTFQQKELKSQLDHVCLSKKLTTNTKKYNAIKDHALSLDKQFMSYVSFNNFINGTRTSSKPIKYDYIQVMESFCNKFD